MVKFKVGDIVLYLYESGAVDKYKIIDISQEPFDPSPYRARLVPNPHKEVDIWIYKSDECYMFKSTKLARILFT